MKRGQPGYALIELIIAAAIAVLVTGAAVIAIFQVFNNTQRSTSHIIAASQVQNVGFWVDHDAQMALEIKSSENLSPPGFLSFKWTDWDAGGNPTYHTANYTFQGQVDGVGNLYRHYSSSGANGTSTLIAQHIYYDPSDVQFSSNTTYQEPLLIVTVTSKHEGVTKTRQYIVRHRPGL